MIGGSLKVLNFLEFLRKKIQLDSSSSLFLFADEKYLVKSSKSFRYKALKRNIFL